MTTERSWPKEDDMNECLVRMLEKFVDFTNHERRFVRDDGSFDWSAAVREWRELKREARVVLAAAVEEA